MKQLNNNRLAMLVRSGVLKSSDLPTLKLALINHQRVGDIARLSKRHRDVLSKFYTATTNAALSTTQSSNIVGNNMREETTSNYIKWKNDVINKHGKDATFLNWRPKDGEDKAGAYNKQEKEIGKFHHKSNSGVVHEEIEILDEDSQPPAVLVLKRQAIRQFPDGSRVALYHSDKLNLKFSVPYSTNSATGKMAMDGIAGVREEVEEEKEWEVHYIVAGHKRIDTHKGTYGQVSSIVSGKYPPGHHAYIKGPVEKITNNKNKTTGPAFNYIKGILPIKEAEIQEKTLYHPAVGDVIKPKRGGKYQGVVVKTDRGFVYFRHEGDRKLYKTHMNNVRQVEIDD